MELKKRLDIRTVFAGICALIFVGYVIFGLQPAEAVQSYEISGRLSIPNISLSSDVTMLELEDHELKTPDTIVGGFSRAENKILLIGHSSTVFQNLNKIKEKDEVIYNDNKYLVEEVEILEKAKIDMSKILARADKDTLVIMTCAGTNLDDGDATHRLIVTALKD